VDTLMDVLTGHLVGGAFSEAGGSAWKKLAKTAVGATGQTAGEGLSEGAGKIAEGKNPLSKAELNDVLLEMVFGAGTSAVTTAAQAGAGMVARAPGAAAQAASAAKEEA